jgi:homoserine O-succinyltransferase
MTRLIDWARTHTVSTIWSCLAAHAAAYRLDGIKRQRRDKKLSGVFACERFANDWSGATDARQTLVPHSRYNELPRAELEAHGYSISAVGDHVGVDVFWRREPSLFLFLQGHPEYDADTLLKEYRRDVLRFATGQREEYPEQPIGAFSLRARDLLDDLRARALAGKTDVETELMAILAGEKSQALWARDSTQLYRDWLALVMRQCGALRDTA